MCGLVNVARVLGLVRTTLFLTVKSVAMFLAAGLASIATHRLFVLSRCSIVVETPVTRTSDAMFLRTCVLFEMAKLIIGNLSLAVCLNA